MRKLDISRKSGFIIGAILFFIALILMLKGRGKAPDEMADIIRPVKTYIVGSETVNKPMKFTGKVSADRTVDIGFEVSGQLIEFPTLEGDRVYEGQMLGKLDPRDYQNERDSAQAGYERAKAHLGRIRKAVETGAVSKNDLTNAEADLAKQTARLRIAEKALEDTVLRAKFAGVVSETYVDNFQNILAKEPILRLQDTSIITIEANFPEKLIAIYKEGEVKTKVVAMFDYLPGVEFDLALKEFRTDADAMTQTYLVTFKMKPPKDFRVLPGMTATVGVYIDKGERKIYLPVDMILIDSAGNYYVWKLVRKEHGAYITQKQMIGVGAIVGDMIEVFDGVNYGERIVAAGIHFIEENQKVRLFDGEIGEEEE